MTESTDRSCAFLTGGTRLPIAGAVAPACDVEKNTGSIESKSCSSRIRCTRTDPTIPRHPMSPTFMMRISLSGGRALRSRSDTGSLETLSPHQLRQRFTETSDVVRRVQHDV